MKAMTTMIGLAIRCYRATPLHPGLNRYLAPLLGFVNRSHRKEMFVHDTGRFLMNIDLSQTIDAKIHYTGAWEPDVEQTILKLLPPGGTGIDVGANIGYLSLAMAARAGVGGRVIAFEPTAWAFERLRANVDLNDMGQVTAVQAGVGDEVGQIDRLPVYEGYRLDARHKTVHQPVKWTTLDHYLSEHPQSRVDLIKSDTEGWETRVFRGSTETLRRFRPALVFELFPGRLRANGSSAEELTALLREAGYRFLQAGALTEIDHVDDLTRKLSSSGRHANIVALAREPHG